MDEDEKRLVRETQAKAEIEARAREPDLLPEPPAGLPALKSVEGAAVLGYSVSEQKVTDMIGPDGRIARPGDEGFLDAQLWRLGQQDQPKGWEMRHRTATTLYAVVQGNPILLEEAARALGYEGAFAVGPNLLELTEIG